MKTISKWVVGGVLCAMILPLEAVSLGDLPLPPLDDVLHRVLERVDKEGENDRQFNAQYIYSRTKQTETRNGQGELKKTEKQTKEHDPTIVRVAARARSMNSTSRPRPVAAKNTSGTNETGIVRGQAAFEKNDFPLNDDLLKRFKFTLVGRETLNGRSALVLDFVPARNDLPERNLKDRFINKAAGRVWVDEADAAVVKADLHLMEKVSVAGGLVGAVWKFSFGFTRERLPDGLWFTRASDWHLEGRELFVRKTIDYQEERTDVRSARPPNPPPLE